VKIAAAVACVALVAAIGLDAKRPSPQAAVPQITVEDVLLAADRMRADRWYPEESLIGDDHAGRLGRAADMDILVLAARHPSSHLRRFAVREFGRFETPANVAFLTQFLDDPQAVVRAEAADALVQSLVDHPDATAEIAMAITAMEERFKREVLSPGRWYLWTRMAELPLPASLALKYEREWIDEIQHMKDLRFHAANALLVMFQTHAREPDPRSERAVETWAEAGLAQGSRSVLIGNQVRGDTATFLRLLQAMRADNDAIAIDAAQFTCRADLKTPIEPCSAPIREIGAELLNPNNPAHLPTLEAVARNRLHTVGAAAAIRKLISAPDMPLCTLLEIAKGHFVEREVVAALEKVKPERYESCVTWDPSLHLLSEMQPLATSTTAATWVLPVTADETLAKRLAANSQKDEARTSLMRLHTEVAVPHLRWEVRMAAARAATLMEDSAGLTTLMADKHHNVRAEALKGLVTSGSPAVWPAALEQLRFSDDHLLLTAVKALTGIPDQAAAIEPLLGALERMSKQQRDTSRRVRVALVQRVAEFTTPGTPEAQITTNRLQPLLRDFDPVVADAVAVALAQITAAPTRATPTRRAARQPNAAQLRALPPCFSIKFEHSPAEAVLLLDRMVSPLAIARLVDLIHSGYYNGTVMHSLDENIAIGGSPAANDEGGLDRVIRDEVGNRETGQRLVLIGHERDQADGRLGIRFRPNATRYRRETVLGQFLRLPQPAMGGAISSIWVGAPEEYRRGACGAPPGIRSITGLSGEGPPLSPPQ
jgi:HEAT repeat protein